MNNHRPAEQSAHDLIDHVFLTLLPEHGLPARPEQIRLSHAYLDAIIGRKIMLSDAGVGIGKTYAYIVAAIAHHQHLSDDWWIKSVYQRQGSALTQNRLSYIISTSSIALQQAILHEYLPFLSSVLLKAGLISKPISAVLRKGKGNYICEKRLCNHQASRKARAASLCVKGITGVSINTADMLLRLNAGQFELDQISGITSYDKKQICVKNTCGNKCQMAFNCRYFRHMLSVKQGEYLFQVCNHNYFLADLRHRTTGCEPLLADYKAVILDEAHKFADAARQMYGYSICLADFSDIVEIVRESSDLPRASISTSKAMLKLAGDLFDRILCSIHRAEDEEGQKINFVPNQELLNTISLLIGLSRQLRQSLVCSSGTKLIRKLLALEGVLQIFRDQDDSFIYQIDAADRSRNGIVMEASLYDLTKHLENDLWKIQVPFVLTSGTMAINNDYTRIQKTLGLTKASTIFRLAEHTEQSPFDYQRNCLIYLPGHMPSPNVDQDLFVEAVAQQIIKLIGVTNGHTLVLFTSYRLMSAVSERVAASELAYPLITANRDFQLMVGKFKALPNAILFATGSCWEGMDFPGDIVSSLIIVTLPFAVPDQLSQHEQRQYLDFHQYMAGSVIPDMQTKLRQGFGRAIRTESDTCVISILDHRAGLQGKYHQQMLDALPSCPITTDLRQIKAFLQEVKSPQYWQTNLITDGGNENGNGKKKN